MKGKKADTNFIADFVLICAKNGLLSPEEITKKAESEIQAIDEHLKKIVDLKKKRSKLLDVVDSFNKQEKNKTEDKLTLPFYGIKDLKLAVNICNTLDVFAQAEFFNEVLSKEELFVAKQLINLKVLKLERNKLLPSDRYNDFIDFGKTKSIKK